jgi:hypothetical protein
LVAPKPESYDTWEGLELQAVGDREK